MEEKRAVTMEKLVTLCKTRGFIFPGSEIYGGLANTWDYGPLGVELKNNVKKAWWKKFVTESPYNVGLDSAILMNPQTWVASGHLGGFSDPLMDCKVCKTRHRADKLIEEYLMANNIEGVAVDGWSNEKMLAYINENFDASAATSFYASKINAFKQVAVGLDEDVTTYTCMGAIVFAIVGGIDRLLLIALTAYSFVLSKKAKNKE